LSEAFDRALGVSTGKSLVEEDKIDMAKAAKKSSSRRAAVRGGAGLKVRRDSRLLHISVAPPL